MSVRHFDTITREQAAEAVAAIEAAIATGATWPMPRGKAGRSALREACEALGVPRNTLMNRLHSAQKHFGLAPNGAPPLKERPRQIRRKARPATGKESLQVAPLAPAERRDAAFWRNRFTTAEKARLEAEALAEQLAGIRDVPLDPPAWLRGSEPGRKGRSVIGALVSDLHMGEVIDAEEVAGINAYDVTIAKARMRRYFEAVATVGQRWASDTTCEGVLLALAGDLISGDIHEELRNTNEITAHEQVTAAAETISAGIALLLETYPRVLVIGVPGNHGRTTPKPTAKLYARLSYDILICHMVRQRFAGDRRVSFQYGRATDQLTPVFGRLVFTTHGDKIGTKGGMGFAGPNLPIVRGGFKIEAQQARLARRPDLIQFGHYHTSSNPGAIFANGSVPGYSEYGNDLRGGIEPPQQWMYLLHDRWWLRERCAVQLEEPATPEKPRVTVQAWSSPQ